MFKSSTQPQQLQLLGAWAKASRGSFNGRTPPCTGKGHQCANYSPPSCHGAWESGSRQMQVLLHAASYSKSEQKRMTLYLLKGGLLPSSQILSPDSQES